MGAMTRGFARTPIIIITMYMYGAHIRRPTNSEVPENTPAGPTWVRQFSLKYQSQRGV